MTKEEQQKIFANNLKYYLSINELMQKDVANAIGVSHQLFSKWCNGGCIPRMDKIEKLATYFGISKSDLIDEKDLSDETTNDNVYFKVDNDLYVKRPSDEEMKDPAFLRLYHYYKLLNESQKTSVVTILKGMTDGNK